MEGEKTVDRANETAVKSASDKENYTVMFVHIGAISKFSTRLAHFYWSALSLSQYRNKRKGGNRFPDQRVFASASLRLAAIVAVSQFSCLFLFQLRLRTNSRKPSNKCGVTIGGTHCRLEPIGWELKRVTGNFCIFCGLERHSTALRFWFSWSVTDTAFVFRMEGILLILQLLIYDATTAVSLRWARTSLSICSKKRDALAPALVKASTTTHNQ